MVNVKNIQKILDKYFDCTGKIQIDPETGVVSSNGSVKFKWEPGTPKFSLLPVKFGRIRNDFIIGHGKLVSLRGAPSWVGRNFKCGGNQLTSLEHAPEHVGGAFECNSNQLTSLMYAPKYVGGNFHCQRNQLTNLDHCPSGIQDLFCMDNHLATFQGAPKVITGELRCWGNKTLQSLDGLPDEVHDTIWMDEPEPHLPLLRLLAVKGVTRINLGYIRELEQIMNAYLGKGKAGAIKCAAELIKAGYKDHARW